MFNINNNNKRNKTKKELNVEEKKRKKNTFILRFNLIVFRAIWKEKSLNQKNKNKKKEKKNVIIIYVCCAYFTYEHNNGRSYFFEWFLMGKNSDSYEQIYKKAG